MFRVQLDIHWSYYMNRVIPIQPPVLSAAAIKRQEAEKKARKEQKKLKAFNQRSTHEFEHKQD